MKLGIGKQGKGKRWIDRPWILLLLVPACLFLVPFHSACKPQPGASEKLKALETKAEKVVETGREKVEAEIESLEARFSRERVEFKARFDTQLRRAEERLAELKRRAELDAEKQPEIAREMRMLEERTRTLRERIQRVTSATSEQWEEIKKPWQKKPGYEDYEDEILKETST